MRSLRPIETEYRSVTFRSRTEARWAVWFDAMEWGWQYEQQIFTLPNGMQYVPDFWIEKHDCFAEVKPCFPTALELLKIRSLPQCLLLIETPNFCGYWILQNSPRDEKLLLLDNPLKAAPMDRRIGDEYFSMRYHQAVEKCRSAKFDGYDEDRETIKRRYR